MSYWGGVLVGRSGETSQIAFVAAERSVSSPSSSALRRKGTLFVSRIAGTRLAAMA